jgi:hypothetical protein
MDWQEELISLYLIICKYYEEKLWVYCQRMSSYSNLSFKDEEVIVIYLFGIMKGHRNVKAIYNYTKDHLSHFFPDLKAYEGYNHRLNQVVDTFIPLIEEIQKDFPTGNILSDIYLMDSMPIMLAKSKRSSKAKVAPAIANKGYCASKDEYYYGVKLHILGLRNPNSLPIPDYIGVSSASEHDLAVFRQIEPYLCNGEIYMDKAYHDNLLKRLAKEEKNLDIYTPIKKKSGELYIDTFDQWLSTAISKIRQPIESLFNWLEEKTGIQRASKVRSYNGLMIHVFGRLAAGIIMLSTRS